MNLRYLKNGETLVLDPARCTGCRECVEVCPHAVFAMTDGKATILDRGACMECGACARNCAAGAIGVKVGVGCAAAIIGGMLRGTAPTCGRCDAAGAAKGAAKGAKACC
jgi:NAD-dependent dihydropyrimidine dehydrogenase PreA subunit